MIIVWIVKCTVLHYVVQVLCVMLIVLYGFSKVIIKDSD